MSGAANVDLKRLNLVYAENGRGKTTLSAILRSLMTGEPVQNIFYAKSLWAPTAVTKTFSTISWSRFFMKPCVSTAAMMTTITADSTAKSLF